MPFAPSAASIGAIPQGTFTVNAQIFGAGGGVLDDTAAIHRAAALAGANKSLTFPPGTYRVTGLTVDETYDGQHWIIQEGAEIYLISASNATVIKVQADNFKISGNGIVNGNRAGQSVASGIYGVEFLHPTQQLTRAEVFDIEIKECIHSGLRFGNTDNAYTSNVKSHDHGTATNAASGIEVIQGAKSRHDNAECYNCGVYGDATTYDGDGLKIQDNSPPTGAMHEINGGIFYHCARRGIKVQAGEVAISGANIDDCSGAGIGFSGNGIVSRGTITGCISTNCFIGLQVDYTTALTIDGCYLRGRGNTATIDAGILSGANTQNLNVSDTIIHNFGGPGIHYLGVTNGTISSCDIYDNGQSLISLVTRAGIYLGTDSLSNPTTRIDITGTKVYNTGGGTTTYYGLYIADAACILNTAVLCHFIDGLTVSTFVHATAAPLCWVTMNFISTASLPQFSIGGGTSIRNIIQGNKTWDPASLATGATDTTTVTVSGAAVGDLATAGFSVAVPAGMLLTASVTAANTVTVTLYNVSAANPTDLASGTLRAMVVKY